MKIYTLRGFSDGSHNWRRECQISKKNYCALFLIAFGVTTVGLLGVETSFSLFILTGVLQSYVFGVPVNDLLVACKI